MDDRATLVMRRSDGVLMPPPQQTMAPDDSALNYVKRALHEVPCAVDPRYTFNECSSILTDTFNECRINLYTHFQCDTNIHSLAQERVENQESEEDASPPEGLHPVDPMAGRDVAGVWLGAVCDRLRPYRWASLSFLFPRISRGAPYCSRELKRRAPSRRIPRIMDADAIAFFNNIEQ